jgi:hypothetical protein
MIYFSKPIQSRQVGGRNIVAGAKKAAQRVKLGQSDLHVSGARSELVGQVA